VCDLDIELTAGPRTQDDSIARPGPEGRRKFLGRLHEVGGDRHARLSCDPGARESRKDEHRQCKGQVSEHGAIFTQRYAVCLHTAAGQTDVNERRFQASSLGSTSWAQTV